jgi:predicted Zn finger-like uncharacterized protein
VQAICPQCSQKIGIDDAKVPDRPFNVKCPRCQNVLKLPGKGAGTEAGEPAAGPAAAGGGGAGARPEASKAPMPPAPPAGFGAPLPGERALLAITDSANAAALTGTLSRLGYPVDPADEGGDAARQLEQGVYAVVATTRAFSAPSGHGQSETLYQRITRLSPENRRRLFVVLVGDEFASGNGTQAFAALVDLVLNTTDLAVADNLIRGTVGERRRVYQVFHEARTRFEASAS